MSGGSTIKDLANIVTSIRFLCAFLMIYIEPFSLIFWIVYICCGMSDILDGIIARALHVESEMGAKLDSIADVSCIFAMVIILIPIVDFPKWIWVGIICITFIRVLSYLMGFAKYHTFYSLHTYANKMTGVLLFVMPVIYMQCGINVTGNILCLCGLISAIEELVIVIVSKEFDRNCKSLFDIISR